MVLDYAPSQSGPLGDLPDAGRGESLLEDVAHRFVDDCLPAAVRAGLSTARRSAGRLHGSVTDSPHHAAEMIERPKVVGGQYSARSAANGVNQVDHPSRRGDHAALVVVDASGSQYA